MAENRRCEGVARTTSVSRESPAVRWGQRAAREWVTEGGREQKVASDGAFPLQKESMMVLVTRQRNFAVKLGGNTERFVPKRVASCFYFTKMQNMYVYAQIVFRDHGKLFCVKIYFRR